MEFPYVVPKGSDAPTSLAKDAYSIRTSAQDISALLLRFSWCKAVNAFENALRTLQRWSEHPLMPWPLKSKVSTLTCFGAMQKTSGFSRRPRLPMQSDTIDAIIRGYAGGREFTLPRAWIQEQALPRVVRVDMSAAELGEGPYARFLRWQTYRGRVRRRAARLGGM